jgi:hypothetical protein
MGERRFNAPFRAYKLLCCRNQALNLISILVLPAYHAASGYDSGKPVTVKVLLQFRQRFPSKNSDETTFYEI